MSCRCPGGFLETPPRWHATVYYLAMNLRSKNCISCIEYLLFYSSVEVTCVDTTEHGQHKGRRQFDIFHNEQGRMLIYRIMG